MLAADLVLTRELVFAWKEPNDPTTPIHSQVIVEFKNQGKGWAQIFPDLFAKISVFASSGALTYEGQGWLGWALPEFVAPGETGYLFGDGGGLSTKLEDYATVEYALGPGSLPGVKTPGTAPCHCFRSVAPPGVTFHMDRITWRSDASHPGLLASGSVTVSGGNAIPLARVAVLCIGADGSILGATTVRYNISDVHPNEPTAFDTVDSTPPLKPSDCATSIGLFGVDHSPPSNRPT